MKRAYPKMHRQIAEQFGSALIAALGRGKASKAMLVARRELRDLPDWQWFRWEQTCARRISANQDLSEPERLKAVCLGHGTSNCVPALSTLSVSDWQRVARAFAWKIETAGAPQSGAA